MSVQHFNAGDIIRHIDGSELLVHGPDTEYTANWRKVGTAKYDPRPFQVGDLVRSDGKLHTILSVNFDGAWIRGRDQWQSTTQLTLVKAADDKSNNG